MKFVFCKKKFKSILLKLKIIKLVSKLICKFKFKWIRFWINKNLAMFLNKIIHYCELEKKHLKEEGKL